MTFEEFADSCTEVFVPGYIPKLSWHCPEHGKIGHAEVNAITAPIGEFPNIAAGMHEAGRQMIRDHWEACHRPQPQIEHTRKP